MFKVLRRIAFIACGLLVSTHVLASQAGWRQIEVPGLAPDAAPIQVALYYPTQAPERPVTLGVFSASVAMQGAPDPVFKGLIVLSHGTGGSQVGHSSLAEALARHGYLVAALRHPGDNWQDRSLLRTSPSRFFSERPQHVSRVIDALLQHPELGDRITRDNKGPVIGALGHSAGGYTVIALVGGQPDLSNIAKHCAANRAEDPIFCGMGPTSQGAAVPAAPGAPMLPMQDARVRAVVALAPLGVVFTAQSLATVQVPVAIYEAEGDRFLVPRFHAEWIVRNLSGAQIQRVPDAWHFAFIDTPNAPIASEDGDLRADPAGFDRQALLQRLKGELPIFFDKAFR